MVRIALILSVSLLTVAFGGCFADEGSSSSTGTTTSAAAAGNNTTTLVNTPPVASLVILFNGTRLVEDNGTLMAPAGENLTFDASNSTDAEGGNLTFRWDLGGNATLDGAVVTYAFNATGNQTVVLTVTDDGGLASAMNATLVVGSAGPGAGVWLREDKQDFGKFTAQTYIANGCAQTISKDWVLVDAEENGTASVVSKVVVSLGAQGGSGLNGYTKLAFKDPAGAVLKENNAGTDAKSITVEGPLPAGTYKVEASNCATYLKVQTGTPALTGVATYVSV